MRYVVVYTKREAIVIDAANAEQAESRAIAVLTGGALYPKAEGLRIEKVVRG